MSTNYSERIIISVGGSLIVPNEGISTQFLMNLNKFIREQLATHKNRQFFLVIGGGHTARKYRDAGRDVLGHELSRDDLDYLGIHATKLNAHLVRTIFRDIAHPYILKHYEIIRKVSEPLVIAAGWKPGWSTDYCALLVCEDYDVRKVVNLSNIDQVFDKDPKTHKDAKAYERLKWADFRKIVGNEWSPGMNAPFDPVAAKKAQEMDVEAVIMNGNNFKNLENYLDGKEYLGTTITN